MEIRIELGKYDEIEYEYNVDNYDVIEWLVKNKLTTKEQIIEELKQFDDEEFDMREEFEHSLKMCSNNLASALYDVYASFDLDDWLEQFRDEIEEAFRDEAIEQYYDDKDYEAELEYMRTHEL